MKAGEKPFEGKVSLKAIITSPQGRVLICRNHHDAATWDLPGGTLNGGESPEEGLLREIQEELGIAPTLLRPLKADTFIKPKTGREVFVLVYEAALPDESNEFIFDETEISEARWIGREDLQDLKLFPEYHEALEAYFREDYI